MANTRFSELRFYLRTFLNDLNPGFSEFSDKQLNSFIITFVAVKGTPIRNAKLNEFNSDLGTEQTKSLLAAKIAVMMLEHQDTYRFATKILSVGDGAADLKRKINSLIDIIDDVENGDSGIAVDSDGDWRTIFGIEARNNTINDIDNDFTRPLEKLN